MGNINTEDDIKDFIMTLEEKLSNDWDEMKESFSLDDNTDLLTIIKSYVSKVLSSPSFKAMAIEVGFSILAAYMAKVIFANRNQSFLAKCMIVIIEIIILKEVKDKVLPNVDHA